MVPAHIKLPYKTAKQSMTSKNAIQDSKNSQCPAKDIILKDHQHARLNKPAIRQV